MATKNTRRKNLNERVKKARLLAPFAGIESVDERGRPTSVIVPGTGGARYLVTLLRGIDCVSTDCFNRTTQEPCRGNGSGVCYHSIAAMLVAVDVTSGQRVSVALTKTDADRLNRIWSGNIYCLKSRQNSNGNGELRLVVA